MARVKRGYKRRRRANKVLDQAEGFVLGRKNLYRRAKESVVRANVYAYRDRRVRKRAFRSLWITRLNAAAQESNLSYSQLIHALQKAKIKLDRKVLSDLAIFDPNAFSALVNEVHPASQT